MVWSLTTPFHAVLIVTVTVAYLTFYLIVPTIPEVSKEFKISEGNAWQLATVYEVSKFIGVIVLGWLSVKQTSFNLIVGFCLGHCFFSLLVATGLTVFEDRTMLELAGLFFFFAIISAFSMGSQLGLVMLKETSKNKDQFEWLVGMQGIVANALAAFSPLASETLYRIVSSLSSPFWLMGALSGVCVLFMFALKPSVEETTTTAATTTATNTTTTTTTTPPNYGATGTTAATPKEGTASASSPPTPPSHVDPDSALLNKKKVLQGEEDTYWTRLHLLGTSSRYAAYRADLVILGVATATQYVLPLIVTVDLVEMGVPSNRTAWYIVIMFIPNLLARMIPMIWTKVSKDFLVEMSLWFMSLGSGVMLLLVYDGPTVAGHTAPSEMWIYYVVLFPSLLMMVGIGLNMANSKAAALNHVDDWIAGTAISVLKFVQLVFVCVVQFVAALLANTDASNAFAALRAHTLLLTFTHIVGLVFLSLFAKSRAGTNTVVGWKSA